ncbi:MAG: cation transporter [Candidatus Poribacteria bacterium]
MEKSEHIALISIVINIILLAIKYIFAILSGSAGLAADAIHSANPNLIIVSFWNIIYI